jgi:hypothetical protein
MDYNIELQKLIEEANTHGYEFINGEFINNQKFIPVMEVFFMNNSTYESSGYYTVFKKTYVIRNEELEQVFNYAENHKYTTIKWDCGCEDKIYEEVLEILLKYDESKIDYIDVSVGGKIDIQFEKYMKYSNSDKVAYFYFTKDEDNDDFPRGIY